MEQTEKRKTPFLSLPLLKQSIQSNFWLWLVMALGSAGIFIIVNLVVGTRAIFTNIDMNNVQTYVNDEGLSWLQILGLLQAMGFSLSRIQTMSQIDLNSILNELVYKITGVLLPMVYTMIACNKLMAAQVGDGSMAYVLSTPTSRRTVVRTQYVFLVGSLVAMYLIITTGAYLSGMVAYFITAPENINFMTFTIRTLLYCAASFAAIFGLGGICFGASCVFNKSNYSIAVGGGVCILSFIACILGLFGNKVFVSVGIGVAEMNIFNYLTLFTLVDTESISSFAKEASGVYGGAMTLAFLWKMGVLFLIGAVFAFVGSRRFLRKDLPL
ncbi:MAG: ABC transporter permease [Bacilli bacterium]|nr:ABC transporter permease [Bacilli bacterium]